MAETRWGHGAVDLMGVGGAATAFSHRRVVPTPRDLLHLDPSLRFGWNWVGTSGVPFGMAKHGGRPPPPEQLYG